MNVDVLQSLLLGQNALSLSESDALQVGRCGEVYIRKGTCTHLIENPCNFTPVPARCLGAVPSVGPSSTRERQAAGASNN
jgi:hypothetical protein